MPRRTRKLMWPAGRGGRWPGHIAKSSHGFTLLEAIVAIAIVGIALIPIITFVSQMVTGLTRAGDANAKNLAQQSIMELLESMNPLEYPIGDDQIGDLMIHWESADIIPASSVLRVGVGLPGVSIGFYKVIVSVSRTGAGPWFSFDMRKVGYRRITSKALPGTAP